MSLSEQVNLMAQFLDVEMVPVAKNSSSGQLLDLGEMRPRTASWGGQATASQAGDRGTTTRTETDTGTQRKTDRRAAEAEKVKVKGGGEALSKRLGLLGRSVSKKLKKQQRLTDKELRERRKMSIGSATQSTRLSCLTDDMLNDHSQVLD